MRRTDGFCSEECRHEALLRTSATYVRHALFARDRGICTHCRTDCGRIDRMIRRMLEHAPDEDPAQIQEGQELALRTIEALGFGRRRRVISLWQADHRVAIVEGGRDCGLGNYRTLCLTCHALQTRELHRRLRERRQE